MRTLFISTLVFLQMACNAQKPITSIDGMASEGKPKIVVGVVVDQMRDDYLYRFYDKYSDGGFKRLMDQGFNARNHHYHYASTVTGPGHAHIYTGSIPAMSGIVGNEWHEKLSGEGMYVVQDTSAQALVDIGDSKGKMSPANLKVTTITDQLNIANQFQSKIVGVAIKDRGAILPAGHTGDAYWFNSTTGNWITSTFYKENVPMWLNDFNSKKLAEKYSEMLWEPLRPISEYTETEGDDQPYESKMSGEPKAVFPHKFSKSGIATTPWGNTLTLDIALAALDGEDMGEDDITDFLAISFSSPDYAGHAFGPQSKEIEDIYLRLDLEIERLLNELDAKVGVGNYTIFLSADHGVAEIPAFLRKNNVPAGVLLYSELSTPLNAALNTVFGEGKWIQSQNNYQLYLNKDLMDEKSVSKSQILAVAQKALYKTEGIYDIIDLEDLEQESIPAFYKELLSNIYHPKRSGELMLLLEPAWFTGRITGTTHGSMYNYDTHVPFLLYGFGVKPGSTSELTQICDIAPTLAQILKVLEPNGSIGKPVTKALK